MLKQCPRPPDLPDADGKLLPPSRQQQLADEAVLADAKKAVYATGEALETMGFMVIFHNQKENQQGKHGILTTQHGDVMRLIGNSLW